MASRLRHYLLLCTSWICLQVGLLDFGPESNYYMESCGFSDVKHSHLSRKLESRSQKCIFLGYGLDGNFGYRLWDPQTWQVVRSLDVIINESEMHKAPECPIELRRVTFSNVPTPSDCPTHNTRETTLQAASMKQSTISVGTLEQAISERSSHSDSQSVLATEETITNRTIRLRHLK